MNAAMKTLHALRAYAGSRQTIGLDDATIERFLARDPELVTAIDHAAREHVALRREYGELLAGDEAELARAIQNAFVNFYPPENVNPHVALSGCGPWLVTTHGAVLHDNGGYGMLGMGHAPTSILETMAEPRAMANIMTPNMSQKRFTDRLRNEIGQTRGSCPFSHFICMNSGSESVTVACRISDVNALESTGPGGRYAGRQTKLLALDGAFHGRTDRPAQASDSCLPKYKKHLASHSARDNLVTVPPNDLDALREAFAAADREGIFIEMMLMEPVMGEGDPGQQITPAFYALARELTLEHGSLLLVDSIQAGIRGTGYLSVVDYPGFQGLDAPDMETYSKALNAGQYPLSVVACTPRAAAIYVTGVYGNTMTSNPRALEVGCAVLDRLDDSLRENIQVRGEQILDGFRTLSLEFPGLITKIQGTGLLASAELDPSIAVLGYDGIENWLRRHGLGVIHGGENSLRFTPHFAITAEEVDLIIDQVRQGIRAFVAPATTSDTASRNHANA